MDQRKMELLPGRVNHQGAYLESLRNRYGWSYQRIADEIEQRFGLKRSEQAVRMVVQGRSRGMRAWRKEPEILLLIAEVLGADGEALQRYLSMDSLEREMGIATGLNRLRGVDNTYIPQSASDLDFRRRLAALKSDSRSKTAHIA